jgi:hypothetical protein
MVLTSVARRSRTCSPLPLLLLLFICNRSLGQFAKYSNEFLNIGAGARGMAMGNAQVASVTDGTGGYWNPAAIADVRAAPQLNLMHAEYFAGIGKYDFASLALPLKDNKRTLGLTLLRFAVDDIPNTVFLVQPDGSIDFSNITTFSSADYAFLISLAQQVDWIKDKKVNFGLNAKIIHRQAGDFTTSWGFGFDAGIQIMGDRWKLGLEFSYGNVFYVRGGLNNFQQTLDDRDTTNQKKIWIYQPSIGAGFRIGDVEVDYAFTNLANQSNPLYTHVFSLKVDLVDTKKKNGKK